MNSEKQAIHAVTRRKPQPGFTYAEITNEQLLNVEARNDLEHAGLGLEAKRMRDVIEEVLACEHGIGLVPRNHDSVWLIVPIDQRAAHVIYRRLTKLAKLMMGRDDTEMGTLRLTVLDFQTNPHISKDMETALAAFDKTLAALEIVSNEALRPKIERLQQLAIEHTV